VIPGKIWETFTEEIAIELGPELGNSTEGKLYVQKQGVY
jgi:hypothetical protein